MELSELPLLTFLLEDRALVPGQVWFCYGLWTLVVLQASKGILEGWQVNAELGGDLGGFKEFDMSDLGIQKLFPCKCYQ